MISMKDFTWKVFCMTGNIDTYLLMKELEDEQLYEDYVEKEGQDLIEQNDL